MNKNTLEQFILQNREKLDVAVPQEKVWLDIEQALNTAAKPQTLEAFVAKNQAAFDFAEPSNSLWTNINRQLSGDKDCETVEAFIAVNRESFNTAIPANDIWTNIEKSLNSQQKADTLDTFIKSNREAFDEATPSARIWSSVDKTLHPQVKLKSAKVVGIWRVLSIAASVLLLLTVGAGVGIYFTKSQAQANVVASLEDISPEYAEMVRYYNAEINDKVKQVSLQSDDKSVFQDLKNVDKIMAELEAELQKAPRGAEEQIVANLIKSYQIKVDILERVLERIQSKPGNSKQQKLKDDEVNI